MTNDISPEERLLRLIRNPQKQNIRDTAAEKDKEKKPLAPLADSKSVLKTAAHPSIQKYFSFAFVQKIISLVFIIAGAYFIFSFIQPRLGFKKDALPVVTEERIMDTETIPNKQEVMPYEFYLAGLKKRQIFGSLSGPETQTGKVPLAANVDLVKDMNLLGIISGEPPEAIIEDKKFGKTYYVTKGQFIGEFKVEDIQEGKVSLNFRGQSLELHL